MSKVFLSRLRAKHAMLNRKIDSVQRSPRHDPAELGKLKKLRLSLKDQIAHVEAKLEGAVGHAMNRKGGFAMMGKKP